MELPEGLEQARSTPLFDEHTVPAGIRDAHPVTFHVEFHRRPRR